MAITDILNTIEQKAKIQASDVLDNASQKVKQKQEEAEKKGSEYSARRFKEYEQDKIMKEKKSISKNTREESLILSTIIAEELKTLYADALENIANSDEKKVVDFLSKALLSISEEEGEVVSCGTELSLLEKALKNSKKSFSLSKEVQEGKGGFIFKGKKYEMDFSFKNLIETQLKEQTKATLLQKIS